MSERLFGTDGMRGRAGAEPLTTGSLARLGRVVAEHLRASGAGALKVLIGHDGRRSGETLTAALVQGLTSGAADVDIVGLAPTPCLAYLTAAGGYTAGIVVSASHNPAADNGVKLLGGDGAKLDDERENAIEQLFLSAATPPDADPPGEARRTKGMTGDYVAWLRNEAFPELDLKGWRILLDCANGAYSQLGPRILKAFGAETVALNDRPNGDNINDQCGALYPEVAARAMKEQQCRIGLSVDGDGDRGILCDAGGRILDGDALLAGLGMMMHERGALAAATVAATIMSNLALEKYLAGCGAKLLRTPVGDRYVAAAMREHRLTLGGEKSGHILFGAEHGYRGDGVYTLLKVSEACARGGISPSQFAAGYSDLPQKLINLPVTARKPLAELPLLAAEVARLDRIMAGRGRSVVRFSGTELKLRLMVEAETADLVEQALARLRAAAAAEGILA